MSEKHEPGPGPADRKSPAAPSGAAGETRDTIGFDAIDAPAAPTPTPAEPEFLMPPASDGMSVPDAPVVGHATPPQGGTRWEKVHPGTPATIVGTVSPATLEWLASRPTDLPAAAPPFAPTPPAPASQPAPPKPAASKPVAAKPVAPAAAASTPASPTPASPSPASPSPAPPKPVVPPPGPVIDFPPPNIPAEANPFAISPTAARSAARPEESDDVDHSSPPPEVPGLATLFTGPATLGLDFSLVPPAPEDVPPFAPPTAFPPTAAPPAAGPADRLQSLEPLPPLEQSPPAAAEVPAEPPIEVAPVATHVERAFDAGEATAEATPVDEVTFDETTADASPSIEVAPAYDADDESPIFDAPAVGAVLPDAVLPDAPPAAEAAERDLSLADVPATGLPTAGVPADTMLETMPLDVEMLPATDEPVPGDLTAGESTDASIPPAPLAAVGVAESATPAVMDVEPAPAELAAIPVEASAAVPLAAVAAGSLVGTADAPSSAGEPTDAEIYAHAHEDVEQRTGILSLGLITRFAGFAGLTATAAGLLVMLAACAGLAPVTVDAMSALAPYFLWTAVGVAGVGALQVVAAVLARRGWAGAVATLVVAVLVFGLWVFTTHHAGEVAGLNPLMLGQYIAYVGGGGLVLAVLGGLIEHRRMREETHVLGAVFANALAGLGGLLLHAVYMGWQVLGK